MREWGERHGQIPPTQSPFTSSFPEIQGMEYKWRRTPDEPQWDMTSDHKWDVKASQEHMRMRMQVNTTDRIRIGI